MKFEVINVDGYNGGFEVWVGEGVDELDCVVNYYRDVMGFDVFSEDLKENMNIGKNGVSFRMEEEIILVRKIS